MPRWTVLFFCLFPATAFASTPGQRFAVLYHPPVPSYTADFQVATIPPNVSEARATTAWDYSTSVDGLTTPIVAFNASVPRWPSWTQRVPTAPLGLGVWILRGNIWRDSSQTQTRTITSGNTYNVWCDSTAGTATVAFTGGLVGTVTANGWPGALQAVATTTSTTGTVTGTVTGCTMTTGSAVFNPPPIISTTGNVTVNADVPSVAIANVTGYNPYAGTIVATFMPTTTTVNSGVFAFSDGTTANRIYGQFSATSVAQLLATVATAGTISVSSSNTGSLGVANKVAFSWGGTRACVSINGGPVASSGSTGLPGTAVTTLQLGATGSGAVQLNGYIEKVAYYPRQLCRRLQHLSR